MPDPALNPATATGEAAHGHSPPAWRARDGDLLGGRYRLTALVASGSTEFWKARDEVLARQVAVRIFGDSQAPAAQRAAFVRAAVAAGQVVGRGISSVYDAATEPAAPRPDDDERLIGAPVSYLVAEWVEGRPLSVRLRESALDPTEACALVSELCAAVQEAHQQDVFAGRLHPGQIILTGSGAPKLTDLAVASVVHGQPAGTGAAAIREDTRGLARILYAALTSYWPEPGWAEPWTGLAHAPLRDGRLCLPRQVKAGLPREVDLVIARTLDPRRRPDDPPISTPRDLRDALAGLRGATEARPVDTPEESPLSTQARPRRKRWLVLSAIVWLVVLGVAGWLLGLVIGRVPGTTVAAPRVPAIRASASGAAAAAPLVPKAVSGFDPQGNDKRENESEVPNATDNDVNTSWDTETYNSAAFGNLKTGVGLLVDLGSPHPISHVSITAPAGERLELLADAGATAAPTSDKQMSAAAGPVTVPAGKDTTLTPASPVTSRWFAVWITTLPPSTSPGAARNTFSGQIAEMSFFG